MREWPHSAHRWAREKSQHEQKANRGKTELRDVHNEKASIVCLILQSDCQQCESSLISNRTFKFFCSIFHPNYVITAFSHVNTEAFLSRLTGLNCLPTCSWKAHITLHKLDSLRFREEDLLCFPGVSLSLGVLHSFLCIETVCKVTKPKVHPREMNSPTETTFHSCLECLLGIPALFISYKMTQSHNTILIAQWRCYCLPSWPIRAHWAHLEGGLKSQEL